MLDLQLQRNPVDQLDAPYALLAPADGRKLAQGIHCGDFPLALGFD